MAKKKKILSWSTSIELEKFDDIMLLIFISYNLNSKLAKHFSPAKDSPHIFIYRNGPILLPKY